VTEDDEERRAQDRARVLHRAHDLGRDHVPGDANDEQLAEPRVEKQLDGHARIAAAEDRRVGLLPGRELLQDLFPHRREPGLAAEEAFVPGYEPRERLLCGVLVHRGRDAATILRKLSIFRSLRRQVRVLLCRSPSAGVLAPREHGWKASGTL